MDVKGVLNVSRRVNSGLKKLTLTANYDVIGIDYEWLSIDPGGLDRDVVLPDATTLPNGWKINIQNISDGSEDILVKDNSTGTLLRTIYNPASSNETSAYELILTDNSTADGVWYINELGDPTINIAKYTEDFLIADWSAVVAGLTTLTVNASTHERGANPMWNILDSNGQRVICHLETVDGSGNITLTVTEDDEFDGTIVII